jgi:branched-chain amino acid transport system permease protein
LGLGGQIQQLIATGITVGAVYALLGLGLTVMFSTTRVVNVAIGEFAMFGALSASSLVAAGVPLYLALLIAIGIGIVAAVFMYGVTIRPAQAKGASVLTLLIITIAVHLAFKGIGLIIWGTRSYDLPAFTQGRPLRIFSAVVTRQSLWVIAATALVLLALGYFFKRTLRGKALLACAVNSVGARLVGIPVARMGMVAFAIAGGLAAAAGVMITPDSLATYDMGLLLGLKGFVGAVMGRLNNHAMTVAGCLALGIVESLAAGLGPSGYRDAVAFLVLIVVLIWQAIPVLRHGVLASEEAAEA